MRCLLLLTLLLAGCGSIRSGLTLDPGATFVLGGEQRGTFHVEILNTGSATVRVTEVTVFNDTLAVAVVAQAETASASFRRGSAALITNLDPVGASLDVRITGDTNLGMRSQDAPRGG